MLIDYLLKVKIKIQRFKEAEDSRYISRNELYKAYFQRDMAFENFKDLAKKRKTASDNFLREKTFNTANIAKNPKYDGHEKGLASMSYKCLIKRFLL